MATCARDQAALRLAVVVQLLVAMDSVAASQLRLEGSGSVQMNGATLSASCSGSAVWQWMSPSTFDMTTHSSRGDNVTVWMLNVAPTCIYSDITEPCASDEPGRPPLFHCTYRGSVRLLPCGRRCPPLPHAVAASPLAGCAAAALT